MNHVSEIVISNMPIGMMQRMERADAFSQFKELYKDSSVELTGENAVVLIYMTPYGMANVKAAQAGRLIFRHGLPLMATHESGKNNGVFYITYKA